MNDEDDLDYVKPKKTIHYGSLEKNVAIQQKNADNQADDDNYEPEAKKPAISSSHTSSANLTNEYYELEQDMYV